MFNGPPFLMGGGSSPPKAWTRTDHGASYGTSGNRSLNPTASIAAGSLVVLGVVERTGTASNPTVSDSQGNTYTQAKREYINNSSTAYLAIYYSNITTALSTSDTFNLTPVNNANASGLLAFSVSNAGTLDTAVSASVAAASVTSLTSGTPSQSNELFVALSGDTNNSWPISNDGGNGWAAPFTSGGQSTVGSPSGASDISGGGGSQVNAGTGTKTYLPGTGAGNPNYGAIIIGFK